MLGFSKGCKMDKRELDITASLAMLNVDATCRIEEGVTEMLHHFEKMMEVDVSGLSPTTHPLVNENRLRDDTPERHDTEALLDNGPETSERFFVVPRVL